MNDSNFRTDYTTSGDRPRKLNGTGIFLLITTILFFGAGIFLFADNQKKSKMLNTTKIEVTESEKRYTDLDAKYVAALAEIDSYKGKNVELDKVLKEKEDYIVSLRSNLNKEKKNRSISEAEYKRQLTDLNTLISDMTAKVEELQKQNSMLIVERDSMGRDISQKATVISELETTNTTLSQKVTVASLLVPTNLSATATRDKSSGKEVETTKADKAQELKVCFNVPENKVAEAGEKTFFVRILSPEGSVLAIQSQGSGVMTAVESGEQMQYTTTTVLNYDQKPKDVCSYWTQTTPYAEGHYTAELYQDGYLVGKTGFDLK